MLYIKRYNETNGPIQLDVHGEAAGCIIVNNDFPQRQYDSVALRAPCKSERITGADYFGHFTLGHLPCVVSTADLRRVCGQVVVGVGSPVRPGPGAAPVWPGQPT